MLSRTTTQYFVIDLSVSAVGRVKQQRSTVRPNRAPACLGHLVLNLQRIADNVNSALN